MIYLDGTRWACCPKAAPARIADVVQRESGHRPHQVVEHRALGLTCHSAWANQLAPLIGAGQDQVVCTDSTSINLYKVLSAALNVPRRQPRPQSASRE